MTVIVGVLCKDSVVIGADSAVTFTTGQTVTIQQTAQKIDIIHDQVIVAGTGAVGLGQRCAHVVEQTWMDTLVGNHEIEIGKRISALVKTDFQDTAARDGQYGALIAFPSRGQAHLCEFSVIGFQPELKTNRIWYVSMGSGQSLADPFLAQCREAFWEDGPPAKTEEGVFAATWALVHTIKFNPGGVGGPITVAVLSPDENGSLRARFLENDELEEHQNNVAGALDELRSYGNALKGEPDVDIPEIPRPEED